MWRRERSHLSPLVNRSWDADLGCRSFRNPSRSLSPLGILDLDFWDESLFKDQKSSAWSCMGLHGTNADTKVRTSSLSAPYGLKHSDSLGMKRWTSASRLASEGPQGPHSSREEPELRASLEERSMRRAELIQKLREARCHLDAQTDLLKTRGTHLQQSHAISHHLELKHKQLSEAVSVLEQDKEAAEQSHFEESRRRAELQDKVLQLELDVLKMRSNLERRTPPTSPNTSDSLSNTLPVTKDQIFRQGQKQTEKEMKNLREALGRSEETAEGLEFEKDDALRKLQASEKSKQEAVNQAEELNKRLSSSEQAQAELQNQLNETRSRLGQMELEKDLLAGKTWRLEDSQNDLKAKLSGALLDNDRLVQEKDDLHQKIQALELQLQRQQMGKQSFSQEVFELHTQLSQAKSDISRQKKDAIFMKEELLAVKELNEKLSSDLTKAAERLQVTLNQLHELEADKLIRTNQIAALEAERLKLIGEMEELRRNANDGIQREVGENLKQDNQNLLVKSQDLEKKVHALKVGFDHKEEELRKAANHWNERWLDAAMTLCSTQVELEELKEAAEATEHAEDLQNQLKKSQSEIQCLLEEKVQLEAELSKVKKDAVVLEMELEACRHQEKLQRNTNQSSPQRLMGSPVSFEKIDVELVRAKEELQKVWDMLKIRDTELVEQQQELRSARSQISQQSDEVQRLEHLLEEREQKLREKDQDFKNLKKQREKTETQIKPREDLHSEEGVISNKMVPEDFESLKALLEEYKINAEQLKQERDLALQKLRDLKPSQQSEAEKHSPPDTKKQKHAGLDLIDPNQQRRLVTEQLKSLFREREESGERSPVFPRRPGLLGNGVPNPKNIKKLEDENDLQGAAKGSSPKTCDGQRDSKMREKDENTQQIKHKAGSNNELPQ